MPYLVMRAHLLESHLVGDFWGESSLTQRAAGACAQVLLDVTSIAPDRILLLDSYFYVVVFHGSSIAQWRKDGFHLNPDHAHFKELLEVHSSPELYSEHFLWGCHAFPCGRRVAYHA